MRTDRPLSARSAAHEQVGAVARAPRPAERVVLSPEQRRAAPVMPEAAQWARRFGTWAWVPPRTLREARRALARISHMVAAHAAEKGRGYKPWVTAMTSWRCADAHQGVQEVLRAMGYTPGVWQIEAAVGLAIRDIDRLISAHGPDYPWEEVAQASVCACKQQEEEKEEKEANSGGSGQPAADEQQGGDGGENKTPDQEGGEQNGDADRDDSQEAHGANPSSEPSAHQWAAEAQAASPEGESAEAEEADRAGEASATRPSTPDAQAGATDAHESPSDQTGDEDQGSAESDHDEWFEPAEGYDMSGGHCRRINAAADAQTLRLRAALRRLTAAVGRRSARQSHKWDARAIVRELVSRRVYLPAARAVEHQPPTVVVLTDHSGSCAHVAAELEAAAAALSAIPGVATVPTAVDDERGWRDDGGDYPEGVVLPERAYGDSAVVKRLSRAPAVIETVEEWAKAAHAAGITHILVLGDVHGRRSYEAARNAGVKVIWLDPNAYYMPAQDTRGMIYEPIRDATPAGIADALERAIRRL